MNYSDSPSKFLLRKLELSKLLDLNLSYAGLMDVVMPLFTVPIQDFLDMKGVSSYDTLFQTLTAYEQRHANGRQYARYRGSPGVRQEGDSFPIRHFQHRNNDQNERNLPVRNEAAVSNSNHRNSGNFGSNGRRSGGAVRNYAPPHSSRYDNRRFNGRCNLITEKPSLVALKNCKNDSNNSDTANLSEVELSSVVVSPVDLPKLFIVLNGVVVQSLWDTGAQRSFISLSTYNKYFGYTKLKPTNLSVTSAQGEVCVNKGMIELNVEVRSVKTLWQFFVVENLAVPCIIGVDFMKKNEVDLEFSKNSIVIHKESVICEQKEEKALSFNLEACALNDDQKEVFSEFLCRFYGLFSDIPGLTHISCHEVDTGDSSPVFSKPYRYDHVKQSIIDYHVGKMLKEDIIMPIVSPYASPVVLCKKNNGRGPDDPEGWRFAIDYRKLNAITRYPQYPIPVIDDLLANITATAYMSTLDLTSGYFQIAMRSEDIEKTAFITKKGCFAFKRMPFGLSGAPATFQRAMEKILRPVLGIFVHVYLDDVIITSSSFEEHLEHLEQVFVLLKNAGLTLKESKCHFARTEIKYLGVKITQSGIAVDNEKIQAILTMPPPSNAKQVARFLGMCAWYAKFIPGFSELCEPLYYLKRKRVKFVWSQEAQDSFERLKAVITSPPVLAHPNYKIPFELATDASSCGVGAVLSQNGRPIAYASRILNSAERNYPITERECLAVIWSLQKFRVYFGSMPVKVITDHSALTKLTNGKGLSARMIRWTLKLAEFNIQIEHRAGTENVVADALSRSVRDNKENLMVQCCALPTVVINSREHLIAEQKADPMFGKIYLYLEDPDKLSSIDSKMCVNWSQDFRLVNGLLFYSKILSTNGEMRVVIPTTLQRAILREFHDNTLAGHLGIRKTCSKLFNACYFPNMRKIIRQYVSSCDLCQKYNYKNVLPAGKLLPIEVTFPLEIVGIDLIGPYPLSNPDRYRYVLVITDYFSKWVEFVPLRKASAHAVATAFFDHFISKYGAPVQVVSDHGKQFVSEIFQSLCRKLDIRHVLTVPYRPQSNQAERVNRTLIQMIATYISNYHDTWDRYIQHFAFALRTSVHDSTGRTPAELFLGRKILTPFERLVLVPENNGNLSCGDVEKLIKEAQNKIKRAQKMQAEYYNMRRRIVDIKVGDKVLLETHFLSSKAQKRVAKFGPKFIGPYRVVRVVNNNLVLDIDGTLTTVNMDQVRVYKTRSLSLSPPAPDSGNPGYKLSSSSNSSSSDNNTSENDHTVNSSGTLRHTKNSGRTLSRTKKSSQSHSDTTNSGSNFPCRNVTPENNNKNFNASKSRSKSARNNYPQHRKPPSRNSKSSNYKPRNFKRPFSSTNTSLNPPKRRVPSSFFNRFVPKKRPVSSADCSNEPLHQRRKYPPEKRPLPSSVTRREPPLRRQRLNAYRPTAAKRALTSATSTDRGHQEKFIAMPQEKPTPSRPPHPYRTRLQSRLQEHSLVSTAQYQSENEKEFIQSFWNSPKQRSDSLVPDGSDSSL